MRTPRAEIDENERTVTPQMRSSRRRYSICVSPKAHAGQEPPRESHPAPPSASKELRLDTTDLDALERAEATPNIPASPDPGRIPFRRTSGRRPLSLLSSSSMNSDLSHSVDNLMETPPLHDEVHLQRRRRHHRHRSMLGASIDYKSPPLHYYPPGYQQPNYQQQPSYNGYYQGNYQAYNYPYQNYNYNYYGGGYYPYYQQVYPDFSGSRSTSTYSTPQGPSGPVMAPTPPASDPLASNSDPIAGPVPGPTLVGPSPGVVPAAMHEPSNPESLSSGMPTDPPALNPNQAATVFFDSPVSPSHEFGAEHAQALLQAANEGIQDVFVALAYKERQVLEAKQTWELARDDLDSFRRQLDEMLAPVPGPVTLPVKPSVISRRHQPNVGINSLQYVASPRPLATKTRDRVPSRRTASFNLAFSQQLGAQAASSASARPRVVSWKIDNEVPSPAQPANMDDLSDDSPPHHEQRSGIAYHVVKCLLGVVHCIIATLPVHQRDIYYHQDDMLFLIPEYPTPMDALFGHLSEDVNDEIE